MTRVVRLLHGEPDDQEGADRQTASLAGLAVALLLVALSLYLMRHLQAEARLEDCLFAGRHGCDAMVAATP